MRELGAIIDDLLVVEQRGLPLRRAAAACALALQPSPRPSAERPSAPRWSATWTTWFRTRRRTADVERDPDGPRCSSPRSFVVRSRLWVPLIVKAECLGAIGLGSDRAHRFDATHRHARLVADLTAMVYRNVTVQHVRRPRARRGREASPRAVREHEPRGAYALNGIMGMAALLVETPLSGEQGEFAQVIRTSAWACSSGDIVSDVLDVVEGRGRDDDHRARALRPPRDLRGGAALALRADRRGERGSNSISISTKLPAHAPGRRRARPAGDPLDLDQRDALRAGARCAWRSARAG